MAKSNNTPPYIIGSDPGEKYIYISSLITDLDNRYSLEHRKAESNNIPFDEHGDVIAYLVSVIEVLQKYNK